MNSFPGSRVVSDAELWFEYRLVLRLHDAASATQRG